MNVHRAIALALLLTGCAGGTGTTGEEPIPEPTSESLGMPAAEEEPEPTDAVEPAPEPEPAPTCQPPEGNLSGVVFNEPWTPAIQVPLEDAPARCGEAYVSEGIDWDPANCTTTYRLDCILIRTFVLSPHPVDPGVWIGTLNETDQEGSFSETYEVEVWRDSSRPT